MKLERGLKHQNDAVNSIIRVFEDVEIEKTDSLTANPYIDLNSANIISNIKKIQENNNVPKEMKKYIGITDNYLNIDIKMETGTGKTFTQIKTIYELNEKYGFNKFIIVVPTLPIKAGTQQFIISNDTKKFFEDEYNQVEIELRLVESLQKKKGRDYFPSVIREFVTASNLNSKKIQVMLINSQLITNGKMLTKEYDTTILDDLTNPSEAIKATKPILIIDEPHKFGKENVTFKKIKEILTPQCIIRFGATFPNKNRNEKDYQNLIYNLSSIDAFNNNLVKGVIAEYVPTYSNNNIRIKLLDVKNKEKCIIQRIEENAKKSFELNKNDTLSIVHEDFDGVEIIGITKNSILLSNGIEVAKGTELSPESYSMSYQDMMIETALERHFEIEKENFQKGIKTLALFFIDDISAYRKIDNKPTYILDSFERILKDKMRMKVLEIEDGEYKEYLIKSLGSISKCHAGYFSQDNTDKDDEIMQQVNDILHDKEKILKIKDENQEFNLRRFIFSKWTLKEGWDNPNIFTIAKLRSSGSETSKLQEVGRGLRLPVDNNLNRMDREQYYLNYIVDFTEKDFVNELRNEISSETTVFEKINTEQIREIAKDRNIEYKKLFIQLLTEEVIDPDGVILNADKLFELCPELNNGLQKNKVINRTEKESNSLKVRKDKYEQIKKLWELLNQKYIINYSEFKDDEIELALQHILEQGINSLDQIRTERKLLNVDDTGAKITEMAGLALETNKKLKYNEFLIRLSDITNIPIKNIHNSLVKYNAKNKIEDDFFNSTVLIRFCTAINNWKAEELFKRFTYKKTELPIHPTALTDEDGNIKDTIVIGNIGTSKMEGSPQERYLYDTIAYDSEIEKENILEQINEVTVFGKIPKSSIKIPVANGGTYSPDFMYLVDKKDGTSELNLIIESKDVDTERALRDQENYKIECSQKLFEQLEKEGVNIKFRKQLSTDKVGTIVRNLISLNNNINYKKEK
mgnify:CR=1 FL=1